MRNPLGVQHVNSENETVAIEDHSRTGTNEPVKLLVIYDDPPPRGTGVAAPMLIDEPTRDWLVAELSKLTF